MNDAPSVDLCGVRIAPKESTSSTIHISPMQGEWLDSWDWEVKGEWMEVSVSFCRCDRNRVVKYALRAELVDHVVGIEATPQKGREEG